MDDDTEGFVVISFSEKTFCSRVYVDVLVLILT